MTTILRVIDGGSANARWQVAAGAALIAEHAAGRASNTLRIFRAPPTVLIGRHQGTWDTVNMEACLADDVAIARRITGGGAVFLDTGSIGWDLVIKQARALTRSLEPALVKITRAAQAGLERAFPSITFTDTLATGLVEGDTLAIQGFLRIAPALVDPAEYVVGRGQAASTLKPTEAQDSIAIMVGLVEGLATHLNMMPEGGAFSAAEHERAQRLHADDIGTDEFVFAIDDPIETGLRIATHRGTQSTITCYARTSWQDGTHRVMAATISGDFIICPAHRLTDIERAISGKAVDDVAAVVDRYFAGLDVDLAFATPHDLKAAILAALAAKPRQDMLPNR